MRRVSSLSTDDLILEDLETEGERQLKSLLHNQLDTSVSFEQCVSKRQCFAPATVYKPFGEEAAGALTLSQFQILQESDKETASFRELGLTDCEILLWKQRGSVTKGSGFGAAPEAVQERLRAIEEKISERQRILALPQRFAGSKQLNRREMEIENALFQGTDRHSFLRSLYYQDEAHKATVKDDDPKRSLPVTYKEIIAKPVTEEPQSLRSSPSAHGATVPDASVACYRTTNDTATTSPLHGQDEGMVPDGCRLSERKTESVPHGNTAGPVKVTESVEFITEEEIQKNRLSEDEIRKIPKFSSYSCGEPNKVLYLKNLHPRMTVRELISLFARFQQADGPPIQFRMLTGRMRGQAFITFPSMEVATKALLLVNGYSFLGKPVVIEFGKTKAESSVHQSCSSFTTGSTEGSAGVES
ncbi:RNA-binding protein 41 [Rhinatrema bivittatum]|uniref:RNA-binding protein 41 n=1 Tax=Rhinatrema bivittatum TaxID=194408 RepID=UPI00112C8AED|nr:RNA-binding protein 41 [Rhinatrema bivittatum]XP_029463214.1 RNA-binding protein 41 [Rhinatrema bivittatum]